MKRESECYSRKGCLHYLMNGIFYTVISFNVIFGVSGLFELNVYAKTNSVSSLEKEKTKKVTIKKGDEWRYLKGTKNPPRGWNQSGFDDSNWQRGPSGFGYGRAMARGKDRETLEIRNKTKLEDMWSKYSGIYVRRDFTIDDIHAVTNMALSVDCDGPFIVYLNGIEVIRNVSGLPDEPLDVSGFIHEMFPGENILAIEGYNDEVDSDDFSFTPEFELTERLDK